jgi:hypothetical protein
MSVKFVPGIASAGLPWARPAAKHMDVANRTMAKSFTMAISHFVDDVSKKRTGRRCGGLNV